jgi:hypothetical protein
MEGLIVLLWWLVILGLVACFVSRTKNRIAAHYPIARVRWALLIGLVVLSVSLGAVLPQDNLTPGKPAAVAAAPAVEKMDPALTTPQQAGDGTEALRAATIFCLGFKPLLQAGETVEEAESMVSPQPCSLHGKPGYCPNGFRTGPSGDIAQKFGISWGKANADIVAGLKGFGPKSSIAEACVRLKKEDVTDMAPALHPDRRSSVQARLK